MQGDSRWLTWLTLFNLYVKDLIGGLCGTRSSIYFDRVSFNNISYADDTVLLASLVGALRKLFGLCEEYATTHGLSYNVKKSEYIIFGTGIKTPNHGLPIQLNGVDCKRVTEFKYLGHIVNDYLKDGSDIERELRALAVHGAVC